MSLALDGLNQAQQEAAAHSEGPLLIVAGAGAGKTKTITHRILNLIENGVFPEQILAITFTNKAAREMRERVLALLTPSSGGEPSGRRGRGTPFVSTFHALGVYLLRAHGGVLGLSRYFSIYDKSDSLTKIKALLKKHSIDEKRFEPRKILGFISRQKGEGVTAASFAGRAGQDFYPRLVSTIWTDYEQVLAKENALDFDDLLLKVLVLFEKEPAILANYGERWKYIHVDEYQDTNTIQYRLVTLLAKTHRNICVVGDIDQSIYSWRGADYTNILNFEKDYPEATIVRLEQNYRSTEIILEAANQIIKLNKNRLEKVLFTEEKGGEKITLYAALNEKEEADYIALTAQELINQGLPPGEIAVLYRANFQSRLLEEACLRRSLPYQVLGTKFYDRKEIRDLLAFIKVVLNPQDSDSLKRIINVPARGIGTITLDKMSRGEEATLPAKTREKIAKFHSQLKAIKDYAATNQPSEVVRFIIRSSGLETELKKGNEEDQERLENMREFASLAARYDGEVGEEGLLALLTDTALLSDQDSLGETTGGIRLMTVHAAKGLEFSHVFITGLEQDLFPHLAFGQDEASTPNGKGRDEEEERRLFYVALTRAKRKLYLTYAAVRMIFGQSRFAAPSEFLSDISPDLVLAETGGATDWLETTNYIDF